MKHAFELRKTAKDTLLILLGLFVMGMGSAMVYEANWGTSSIGTLIDGMHYALDITRGAADITVSLALFIVLCIWARDLIKIGTFISLFAIGISIDFWRWVFSFIHNDTLVYALVMFALGTVISCMGASFYIAVNAGLGPYDGIIMLVFRVLRWQYRNAKILTDTLMMLVGILLGGVIGIGTVVSIVTGGFLMQFFINFFNQRLGGRSILNLS